MGAIWTYRPRSISNVFILEMPEEKCTVVFFVNGNMSNRQFCARELGGSGTLRAFAPANLRAVQADAPHNSLKLHTSVTYSVGDGQGRACECQARSSSAERAPERMPHILIILDRERAHNRDTVEERGIPGALCLWRKRRVRYHALRRHVLCSCEIEDEGVSKRSVAFFRGEIRP
jgi:hypothetical protein